jgi:phenylpropionate dioxygenase-like ring-hydroxylating dioxygenase large terminal subunit
MTGQEEIDLLTRTGRGTPCGELMRRYWQPAALSDELGPEKPIAVQLFGEELVLFRDAGGQPALIGRWCAHQGVDMIYGRVEPEGIRCMYHGWLFDARGKVIVRGAWVEGGEKRMEVGQPAYPCREAANIIFAYMGPDAAPTLPVIDSLAVPLTRSSVTSIHHEENYLQALLRDREMRTGDVRFTVPNLLTQQGKASDAEGWMRWHVPADDHSHEEFTIRFYGGTAITGAPLYTARESLIEAINKIGPSM